MNKCSFENCNNPVLARGLCRKHYQQAKKKGLISNLPKVNGGKCKAEGCNNIARGSGYCGTHYDRYKKYGDPLGLDPRVRNKDKVCIVQGCKNEVKAKGLCGKHRNKLKKYGNPLFESEWSKKRNKKKVVDGYVHIYVGKHPMANRSGRVPEHRYVVSQQLGRNLEKFETVHHKNGDKTDNRPENLELWCGNHQPGQRVEELVEWAEKILKLYGDYVHQKEQPK